MVSNICPCPGRLLQSRSQLVIRLAIPAATTGQTLLQTQSARALRGERDGVDGLGPLARNKELSFLVLSKTIVHRFTGCEGSHSLMRSRRRWVDSSTTTGILFPHPTRQSHWIVGKAMASWLWRGYSVLRHHKRPRYPRPEVPNSSTHISKSFNDLEMHAHRFDYTFCFNSRFERPRYDATGGALQSEYCHSENGKANIICQHLYRAT
jgi:hypothetical protein